MKNWNIWIIVGLSLVIGILVFLLLNKTDDESTEVKNLKESVKVNEKLLSNANAEIAKLKPAIDSLQNIIDQEPTEDKSFKIITNEKIKTINLYSISEQQSYFDERAAAATKTN